MIFHMGHLFVAIVLILYPDLHIRREFKIIGELLQAIKPDGTMSYIIDVFGLEIFRDHLVQRPPFPAMNLLHSQAFVFLRHGAGQVMGVVP